MSALVLSLLLSQAINDHGIYGGFNLQWVLAGTGLGEVSLTVGSALIDGVAVVNSAAGGFPNDIPSIQPYTPGWGATVNAVAYCYVVDVGGGHAGSAWFQAAANGDHFDFVCEASDSTALHNPTPDGHPVNGLTYPVGMGADTFTHAIFVGSVVTTAYPGLSVYPFFRNGDQVIYATNTKSALGILNPTWDLGVPTGAISGEISMSPDPLVYGVDFTMDNYYDTLPYSASQVILDVEATAGAQVASILCFLDPNQPTISATELRSCQSELLLDTNNAVPSGGTGDMPWTSFLPIAPLRTQLNIGYSPDGGPNGDGGSSLGPYGEIWLGGTGALGGGWASPQTYFDVSYRGYVEPERQLISNVVIPHALP